ncbi:MGMT family protein [Candidatus Sumerlaeota bacterium]|nr:MGMT family protein [Candidatus Sumerlaeota bacterium]MBI3735581.1 MGMT family protein [Candidatus Sumerlaeota bacterium]
MRARQNDPIRSAVSYEAIYAVVRKIPRGRVATYGQIAALAGIPGHARQVGYALNRLKSDGVPWHRVVNSKGEISARTEKHGSEELQKVMLAKEGVRFSRSGRIDLNTYRWEASLLHIR